jgi:hypothetical protein
MTNPTVARCTAPGCVTLTTRDRCALHLVQTEAVPEQQPPPRTCLLRRSGEPWKHCRPSGTEGLTMYDNNDKRLRGRKAQERRKRWFTRNPPCVTCEGKGRKACVPQTCRSGER